MAEASKNLGTKKRVVNGLDLGEKNREKIKKIQMFYLLVCYFDDDGSHNYLTFQPVFINFQAFTVFTVFTVN